MRKRLFSILSLFLLLSILVVTPVLAFEGAGANKLSSAQTKPSPMTCMLLPKPSRWRRTVQGDLVTAGSVITINGTVKGDLIAAGQTIILNGTVEDDARLAAGAILLGAKTPCWAATSSPRAPAWSCARAARSGKTWSSPAGRRCWPAPSAVT